MKLTDLPTELLLCIAYDEALQDRDRLSLRLTCAELCNIISMHPFLDIVINFGVYTRVANKTTTQRLISLMSDDKRLKAMRSLIRSIRVDALDRLSGMTNFTKRTFPTLMETGMLPRLEKVTVNADLLHTGQKDVERLLKLICRYYHQDRELNVSLHNMTITPSMLRHVSHLTSLELDLARFTNFSNFLEATYRKLIAGAMVKSPNLKHLSVFTCAVFSLDNILDEVADGHELSISSLSLQNIQLPIKAYNCEKLSNLRNLALPSKDRSGVAIRQPISHHVQTAFWDHIRSRKKPLDSLLIPGHKAGRMPAPFHYEEPLKYLETGGGAGLRKLTLFFKHSSFQGLEATGENGSIARVGNSLWHLIFPLMKDTVEEICIDILYPFYISFGPNAIGAPREHQFSSLCPKPGNPLVAPNLKRLVVCGVYRPEALTDFMESIRGCARLRNVELGLMECELQQAGIDGAATTSASPAAAEEDVGVGQMISCWKAPLEQARQWHGFLGINLKVYKLVQNHNGLVYCDRMLERHINLSKFKENLVFKIVKSGGKRY